VNCRRWRTSSAVYFLRDMLGASLESLRNVEAQDIGRRSAVVGESSQDDSRVSPEGTPMGDEPSPATNRVRGNPFATNVWTEPLSGGNPSWGDQPLSGDNPSREDTPSGHTLSS